MGKQKELQPNYAEAAKFAADYYRDRPRHISVIHDGKPPITRTFQPGEEEQLRDFVERENHNGGNVYFAVNEIAETAWNKKAQKADVTGVAALHCDLDDFSVEARERLTGFDPLPSIVLCSGGGYQAFWLLENSTSEFDRAEALNKAIADKVGGDACQNVDRIMRLPGTINHPNAKKRAKGRTPVSAQLLREHCDFDRRYTLDDFGGLEKPGNSTQSMAVSSGGAKIAFRDPLDLGISEDSRLYRILLTGDDHEAPVGSKNGLPSRSELRFATIHQLADLGLFHEDIAGIVVNPALGISKSYYEHQSRQPEKLAMYEVTKALAQKIDDWPETYNSGKPKMGFMNAIHGLTRMGIEFSNNTFQNRKQAGSRDLQEFQGDLTDDGIAMLRKLFVEQFGFDPGKHHLIDAVQVLCIENSFHPIRDYLDGLEHDGTPRIERFLVDYMGAEDTPLNRAISKILFVAAVRRIRKPGIKFDEMVVLEGPQGTGKSSALKILAGEENFSDQNLFMMDQKAQAEAIEGVWIFEIAELSGMRHADVTAVKSLLSRAEDRFRPAYARFKERWPRQCIFVGTTNDDTYLKDQTGNRRFWPVLTWQIDLQGIEHDRDQLWAEAAVLEADGQSIRLPPDLWEDARVVQEARMPPDPWLDFLSNPIGVSIEGNVERIATVDLFGEGNLDVKAGQSKDYHAKHLAAVMRQLGWDGPKAMRIGGKIKRGYERLVQPEKEGTDGPSF